MNKTFFGILFLAFVFAGPLRAADEVKDMAGNTKTAIFAGGCFWCMEAPFEKLDGVSEVLSGYTDGETKDPTYREVCSGDTGHTEAIRVIYDPEKVSYQQLLDIFWKQINPTQLNGQFADRGTQYRTGIYYHDEEEKKLAEASKAALEKSGKFDGKIVTEIKPASEFYDAEEYHQDYYKTNAVHYRAYRAGSGREDYLKKMWPSDRE